MGTDTVSAEKQVRRWLKSMVVGLDLCPFAKPVVRSKSLRCRVIPGGLEAALHAVADECTWLEQHASIETSLLILGAEFSDFDDYLDLVAMAEALMADLNHADSYQLASFHPDYQFDDSDADSVENYTNRSPHPILHLLRESSITRVLQTCDDPASIPRGNAAKMRSMGTASIQRLLAGCANG